MNLINYDKTSNSKYLQIRLNTNCQLQREFANAFAEEKDEILDMRI